MCEPPVVAHYRSTIAERKRDTRSPVVVGPDSIR